MRGCRKCMTWTTTLILLLGIALLLVDLGVWGFWGIRWWSGLLIIMGASGLGKLNCPECAKLRKK